jgi:hypothetical protein
MNYKLVDSEDMLFEGEYMFRTWDIVEIPTGLTLKYSLKKDDARSMLRHMNMGGAFNGFTPSFFCKKMKEL